MHTSLERLFSDLAGTYDLLNHLLTWGLHMLWRSHAADEVRKAGGARWIDICSGTGDMAIALKNRAPEGTLVVALDFCLPMLRQAVDKKGSRGIAFVVGDAAMLPFRDGTFDAVTLSFATRNINTLRGNLQHCFYGICGLLRTGGLFVNVETSQPPIRWIRALYHLYVKLLIKPLGILVSGSRTGYVYLSRTIRRFYSAGELAAILHECGFSTVHFRTSLQGIVAVHTSIK